MSRADHDAVVVGGGAAGLAAARGLSADDRSVLVLEAGADVGGLARSVRVGGEPVEAYYHHLFPQDRETRDLAAHLGLEDQLEWHRAPMAILDGNRVYSFNGPVDLLRYSPLSPLERARFGMATAAQIPRLRRPSIHQRSVGRDGPRWFGRRPHALIWRPLLEAKFGPHADAVSMAWLAARIRQRAGARRVTGDRLGYFRGGVGALMAALGSRLVTDGVDIRTSSRVLGVARVGANWEVVYERGGVVERATSRCVIAAVSGALLTRLVELPSPYAGAMSAVLYRGVVCVLIELEHSLSEHYWVNVTDRLGLGCVGIIEHTNFIPADRYGGRHLVYLAHYTGTDEPAWAAGAEELVAAAAPALRRLNPVFHERWIAGITVSRDQFAQPVPLAGGPMRDLPLETGLPGLIHLSLAHVYPDDRGVSNALRLGERGAAAAQAYLNRGGAAGGD